MATRGGQISLPLAVGVDCGYPQVAGGGSQPPPVARSFFFFGSLERQIWPLRVAGSLPLAVGVDRSHPQWLDLSFFFFGFAGKVAGGGRWVVDGGVRRRR
jgi:hypothetical protein